MNNGKKLPGGFTLIELMVVVIIVGVLAAASVPLYQGNVRRAIRAEAISTMGVIRGAQRIYRSDHGVYFHSSDPGREQGTALFENLGLGAEAMVDVSYFGPACYDLTSADSQGFTIRTISREAGTDADQNNAARAGQVLNFWSDGKTVATMDERGVMTEF